MPAAARVGDDHVCPMFEGSKPHKGGPVLLGTPSVMIGGRPAASVGSTCTCLGPPDTVARGSANVIIGGRPAARVGDGTAHGGVISQGENTVQIG